MVCLEEEQRKVPGKSDLPLSNGGFVPAFHHTFRYPGPALPLFCHCEIAFCFEVLSFPTDEG